MKYNKNKTLFTLLAGIACMGTSAAALAEVEKSDAASFTLKQRIIVTADKQASFDALLHPESWWTKGHTWSGNAANLKLDAHAGGCWCERWSGGQVEHARVVFIRNGELLRLQGGFGPLQSMAVNGILEWQLLQGKDGTQVDMSYRVTGAASSKLDAIAPMADKMFKEQMSALKALLDAKGAAARR